MHSEVVHRILFLENSPRPNDTRHAPALLDTLSVNIGGLLSGHARHRPERLAVVFDDQRLTYVRFNARVNRLSKALIAEGLTKRDKLATISKLMNLEKNRGAKLDRGEGEQWQLNKYKPIDATGHRIEVGDMVRVIGIPDLKGMGSASAKETQLIFEYLVGRYKRVRDFNEFGCIELDFKIMKGSARGMHTVWIEPYLLRVKR